MGRAGRGGGMRGGGGGLRGGGGARMGGRGAGSVRGLGSTGGGIAGRGGNAGRGLGGLGTPRTPAPRAAAPRRGPGFGTGMAVGMGMGMMGGRRRRGFGWGGGWGRRGMMGGMGPVGGGGRGCGCGTLIMGIIAVLLILAIISFINDFASPNNWGGGNIQTAPAQITPSTTVREPIERGLANENVPFITDHLGWIGNRTIVENGMRHFHRETGVRPHLYIVGEINGNARPSDSQLEAFAETTYADLFDDHAHILLVFFENYAEQFAMATWAGAQTLTVMNQEARDILMDFMELYYLRADIPLETAFSTAFQRAADHIMQRPPDNRQVWMTVIIVAGVLLLLLLLFNWWKRKQEQKNLEAEQTERILNQDLNTFGNSNDEAAQLAKQYMDDDNNN